jgi:hypothetical protein
MKPVAAVAVMAGINMNSPGNTIRLLIVTMDLPVPNSSARILDKKNVPMHNVAVIAATRCTLCFMFQIPASKKPAKYDNMLTFCQYVVSIAIGVK